MSLHSALDSLADARMFLDRIYYGGTKPRSDDVDDAIKAVADAKREVEAVCKKQGEQA